MNFINRIPKPAAFGVAGSLLLALRILAVPASSVISYQGRLLDGGLPANGNYDLAFSLFDASTNGQMIGFSVTNNGLGVSNGLFTAALDFGPGIFNGDGRWVEIAVRTGTNDFITLNPRQPLTAAPYAITTLNQGPLTAATNDLSVSLAARTTAATNDLNAALSGKITAATNDVSLALSTKTVLATNDL